MPIYMDVHIVPGVKARNVAEAHWQDLIHQHEYGCKCMTYWIDEGRESIFCLIEAPDKDTVKEMHSKTHGLVPHKIIEVSKNLVQSFLGRIYDPEDAETSTDGLKVFTDPGFRILLVTTTTDPVLLKHRHGAEKANQLLREHNLILRRHLSTYDGAEVEGSGPGFIISFSSASRALSFASAVQKDLSANIADDLGFRMSITGGEPVSKSNKLFGDALDLARSFFMLREKFTVSSPVKELISKDYHDQANNFFTLSPSNESLLESLISTLEKNWQDPDFDVPEYCQAMAMSTSQLYRKTIALTDLSPNGLLKEFRLEKAREMMKVRQYTIAQITFDAGFSSPSYFTKCFKKKFGILPATYMEMLD